MKSRIDVLEELLRCRTLVERAGADKLDDATRFHLFGAIRALEWVRELERGQTVPAKSASTWALELTGEKPRA